MPTIPETIEYMKKAHEGQMTKGGDPYWTHPLAVMELLPADATEDERHAALLHDVIEDCGVTVADLQAAGYSQRTIDIVTLVTRPSGPMTYLEWIMSIAALGDIGAIRVKLADNRHNAQPDRIAKLPEQERDIVKRYERSMRILQAALEG